eukprot:TRINITY_DN30230_c0_g1_i1.p1 TRINITY_DN30230_c0_g1~~TRINITY_DN30230_c0_g1_i1.p1  ORF type:complete len:312 (+),score=57.00 TRINITY_DN30230_c0_g1_i1:251-1186(+)
MYFRDLPHATRQDRIEFILPLVSEVREAVQTAGRSLGGVLASVISRSSNLIDLSCLVTESDAEWQPVHYDTPMERQKFSVFIALQDVTLPMGPTWVCPQTHNAASHAQLDWMEKQELSISSVLEELGALPAVCSAGDALIMNSRLLHCGGCQLSAELGGGTRRLLYLSFHDPSATPGEHSLRDELVGKYHLSDFDGGPEIEHVQDNLHAALFVAANKLNDAKAILEFATLLRSRGDVGAIGWFKRAVLRQQPLAAQHLAEIYSLGELGIQQDLGLAEEYRLLSHELGMTERPRKRLRVKSSGSSASMPSAA